MTLKAEIDDIQLFYASWATFLDNIKVVAINTLNEETKNAIWCILK